MILVVDFDGTVVDDAHDYEDLETPLKLKDGAGEALRMMKGAGHTLILCSGRSSLALRKDPELNPLVRAGVRQLDRARWKKMQPVHVARYDQMLAFVKAELPDIFDAIDDGTCGKLSADAYVDDKAIRFHNSSFGGGWSWEDLAEVFGERQAAAT